MLCVFMRCLVCESHGHRSVHAHSATSGRGIQCSFQMRDSNRIRLSQIPETDRGSQILITAGPDSPTRGPADAPRRRPPRLAPASTRRRSRSSSPVRTGRWTVPLFGDCSSSSALHLAVNAVRSATHSFDQRAHREVVNAAFDSKTNERQHHSESMRPEHEHLFMHTLRPVRVFG